MQVNVEDIGIILLAAGNSSRMGQSKQLLKLNDQPLLRKATIVSLESRINKIVVVLGAFEGAHRSVISDLPIDIVHNPEWQKGMGSSLKVGLDFMIKNNPSLKGVIILVCDQPLLTSNHIRTLVTINHKTKFPIVASRYANTLAVPAFFDRKYFPLLFNIDDSQGAKKIIHEYPEDVATMDFSEGEVDLDTPDEYQAFKRSGNLL